MSLDTGYLEQMTDIRAAAAAGAAAPAAAGGRRRWWQRWRRGGQGGGGGGQAAAGRRRARPRQISHRQRQPGVSQEGAEGTSGNRSRARGVARGGSGQAQERTAGTQAVQPAGHADRQRPAAFARAKWVIASVVEAGKAPRATSCRTGSPIPDTWKISPAAPTWATASRAPASRSSTWKPAKSNGWITARRRAPRSATCSLSQPVWTEEGTQAVMTGRSADFKDRWIFALDPATGQDARAGARSRRRLGRRSGRQHHRLDEERPRSLFPVGAKTGYSHLYAVGFDGGEPRALTSGNWEVLNVRQSRDGRSFILTASKDGPYENHLYVDGWRRRPAHAADAAAGKHTTTISPDEQWFADIYSYTNKPPDLFVQADQAAGRVQAAYHVAHARIQPISVAGRAHRASSPRATA